MKRTFWLDPDAYQKLMEIRAGRSAPNVPAWATRASYGDILTDVLHQFVAKHGRNPPRRQRVGLSLPRKAALTLRSVAVKLGVNQTDILNMAIREYDDAKRQEQLAGLREKLGLSNPAVPT